MVLPIRIFGDPILRQPCEPVEQITPELEELARDMLETMYSAGSVGLAAPQVGRRLRLFVMDVRKSKRSSTLWIDGRMSSLDTLLPLAFFNAEIKPDQAIETAPEGCVSIPGIRVDVTRPECVEVWGTDVKGGRIRFRAGGLLARVVQHELDQLHGILFTDRMPPEVLASVRSCVQALEKETLAKLTKDS